MRPLPCTSVCLTSPVGVGRHEEGGVRGPETTWLSTGGRAQAGRVGWGGCGAEQHKPGARAPRAGRLGARALHGSGLKVWLVPVHLPTQQPRTQRASHLLGAQSGVRTK